MEKITVSLNDVELPIPILSWCPNLEEGARRQAENLAFHPKTRKHIAIMPDAHQGYGMPIGGVAGFKGAVCPNAVGVDIGCLDKDTEFMTKSGWKRISEYKPGDTVLQFNKNTERASFTSNVRYIVQKCTEFYHFKNSKGLDQMLSEEHKMLVWCGYRGRGYHLTDFTPPELAAKGDTLNNGYYGVKAAFLLYNNPLPLTDNQIRLDVMVAADGHIRRKHRGKHCVELHFAKKRKVDRALWILSEGKVPYTKTIGKNGTTYIYCKIDPQFSKDLSKYFRASKRQLKVLAEEALKWDGHEGYRSHFSTTNKVSADVVQFAFSAQGTRAGIGITEPDKDNWSKVYVVTPTRNNIVGVTNTIAKVPSQDGKKYCFTVPTGYFVARRNGRIFVTGNCGVIYQPYWLSGFEISEAHKKEWVERVSEAIPVGFARRGCRPSIPELDCDIDAILDQLEYYSQYETLCTPIKKELKDNTPALQLGTLGGGNHFIELQTFGSQQDTPGQYGIMIHSGSRHLGFAIAKYFHEVAVEECNKWASSLPNEDLAFLPTSSALGVGYVQAMGVALSYASLSRKIMMFEADGIFCDILGLTPKFSPKYTAHTAHASAMNPNAYIHVNHNFASLENHMGENLWVHRKGATRAQKGHMCLIPGSMGTSSYVLPGRGSVPSFTSCSHGAGRVMGRGDFTRNHSKEECDKEMEGIVFQGWSKNRRGKIDLSEAPSAYKNIDTVMQNQYDLVEVEGAFKMKSLAVVKG